MRVLNAALRFFLKFRIRQIHDYMKNPAKAQEKWFQRLINKAQQTQWGRKYDYKSIQSIDTFQKRVPLSTYDELKLYIQQMMHGKTNILWPGRVRWFSKSSGTTSDKSKFLPVSYENLNKCHLKGPHDTMAMWYYQQPDTKILANAKGLIMGGTHNSFQANPKTRVGDVSAIMLENMPSYGRFFHVPDLKTALMEDWEAKIEKMAHIAIKHNITNIGGVPTWTMVLFRKILEITGKQHILEVFPNFEVYMHGGVSFEPYRNQFRTFLPDSKVQFRETYNASEGYFASQYAPLDKDMLLFLDNGVFYEFVPVSELNKEDPKAYTVDNVELDKNYALVISTNTGLWRYVIGDTIKFTSLKPHKIQITGRTKHFINVFGEEVMVGNTDKALAKVCQQLGINVKEYTVAPIFLSQHGKGGHEWLIELEPTSPNEKVNLAKFQYLLDKELQKINSDYEAKRHKDIALDELKINLMPKGAFHLWLKKKGKYGGQHKVPRLSNSRKYLEEILAISHQLY
ncbi:MAG: GH3 auxin-responsive promoter family protein [Saprospiraceae bacterium]|nr:GH3 auxin-responsive promoter family protein [Saprospiraceae bacterium]